MGFGLRCKNRQSRKRWAKFTVRLCSEWVLYGVGYGASESADRGAIVLGLKQT